MRLRADSVEVFVEEVFVEEVFVEEVFVEEVLWKCLL